MLTGNADDITAIIVSLEEYRIRYALVFVVTGVVNTENFVNRVISEPTIEWTINVRFIKGEGYWLMKKVRCCDEQVRSHVVTVAVMC